MKAKLILCISLALALLTSCAVTWQEAMKYGGVPNESFSDTLKVENVLGLLILPVEINGQYYRFLYDTGAPFSVSEQLQKQCNFTTITEGKIVDSDHNRSRVNYVEVDSIMLGKTYFYKQTAFVGDFQTNPILKCLELDGIIGSNLMRHCNWSIDFNEENIILTNVPTDTTNSIVVPFTSNAQYDIFVDMKIGKAQIRNIKIDYGSNGYFTMQHSLFDKFDELGEVDSFIINRGESQSGIVGKATPMEEKIAPIDSLWIGDALFQDITMERSQMTLFGTAALSQYNTTIDWQEKRLLLNKQPNNSDKVKSFGFGLGYDENKRVYVQSLMDHSTAHRSGLELGMRVLSVNDIDFEESNFCDYITLIDSKPDSLTLRTIDENEQVNTFTIHYEELF